MADKKDRSMEDAMSRSFPSTRDRKSKDQMVESMKENRAGATESPVEADQQTRAMSNEFMLEKNPVEDQVAEAMSERRKKSKK